MYKTEDGIYITDTEDIEYENTEKSGEDILKTDNDIFNKTMKYVEDINK